LKYVQAFGVQTTHTAISNAQSRLDERLACWLLMAHDRIGNDTLPLTHEFLLLMLAVRRAGVTDALNSLREQELISYDRGKITVRNRKGLERTAGEASAPPEAEYRRLMWLNRWVAVPSDLTRPLLAIRCLVDRSQPSSSTRTR
jgi:hypothetical protein